MRKLLRYIKGYEKQTILAPLFKMLEACFELFVPLVVAGIIDTGIKNADTVYIWQRCGLLVLLAAVGLTCSLTAQYFSATAAMGFGTALRKDLFRHIDTLSYSELDGIGTPTLVTRMTSDINQVQNGVNLTLRLLLRSPFIVLGALIMAFSISPRLRKKLLMLKEAADEKTRRRRGKGIALLATCVVPIFIGAALDGVLNLNSSDPFSILGVAAMFLMIGLGVYEVTTAPGEKKPLNELLKDE